MGKFKISVSNQTQKNRLIKFYFLCTTPFFALIFYQQNYPFIKLEKNTELILIAIITIVPSLFLWKSIRKQSSIEYVSFSPKTILTKFMGPINLDEIANYKSPKNSSWYTETIKINLKNGTKVIFSPVIKQFNNKKNKIEFENFLAEFNNSMEVTDSSI